MYFCVKPSISGHFSQVVWKNTKQAGFGVAKTADGHSIYVVGQYKPAGNYVGQWGAQVPKPLNGKIEVPTAAELRKYIYLPYLIILSRTVL